MAPLPLQSWSALAGKLQAGPGPVPAAEPADGPQAGGRRSNRWSVNSCCTCGLQRRPSCIRSIRCFRLISRSGRCGLRWRRYGRFSILTAALHSCAFCSALRNPRPWKRSRQRRRAIAVAGRRPQGWHGLRLRWPGSDGRSGEGRHRGVIPWGQELGSQYGLRGQVLAAVCEHYKLPQGRDQRRQPAPRRKAAPGAGIGQSVIDGRQPGADERSPRWGDPRKGSGEGLPGLRPRGLTRDNQSSRIYVNDTCLLITLGTLPRRDARAVSDSHHQSKPTITIQIRISLQTRKHDIWPKNYLRYRQQ